MRNERGIVLVLSLLIMTILLVMGVTFLSIALNEHNIARNYQNHTAAFYSAEAAVEVALNQLSVAPDPAVYGGFPTTAFGSGTYDASVVKIGDEFYRITGNGFAWKARSSVELIVRRNDLNIPFGGFGDLWFSIDNNAQIDSYDCDTLAVLPSGGDVVTNGDLMMDSNALVKGNAAAGGTITLIGNAQINGVQTTPAPAVEMPSVVVPGVAAGSLIITGGPVTLDAGTYIFDSVTIQPPGELIVNGAVKIYVLGLFDMDSNARANWAGDPKNLTVYSAYASLTDTDKAVNFNNGSQFVGSVVAPDGLVYLDNTSQVRGAAAGKWIRMDNNSRIRYPQCWENGANLKEFERLSWNQLR